MRTKLILCVIPLFFFSCDEVEEQNAEDCAGVVGGNTVCGVPIAMQPTTTVKQPMMMEPANTIRAWTALAL